MNKRFNIKKVEIITNFKDFKDYLLADKHALGRLVNYQKITDFILKYEILLRRCEYYCNCPSVIKKFCCLFLNIAVLN
ncbi:hypothetical protein TRIP_E190338 [uncultured Spirochaetota bacterium]|uniref:Uncharacterized protein n=1 Tax=uncultured Spirochaetota bacterium TaxID=460511 RepID=A0A652ZUF2_9SPIR|nr:hypothetical protein TRIP_E190338 [uncultured Spirochaetota bacterium]